eukprot:gene5137-6875_t
MPLAVDVEQLPSDRLQILSTFLEQVRPDADERNMMLIDAYRRTVDDLHRIEEDAVERNVWTNFDNYAEMFAKQVQKSNMKPFISLAKELDKIEGRGSGVYVRNVSQLLQDVSYVEQKVIKGNSLATDGCGEAEMYSDTFTADAQASGNRTSLLIPAKSMHEDIIALMDAFLRQRVFGAVEKEQEKEEKEKEEKEKDQKKKGKEKDKKKKTSTKTQDDTLLRRLQRAQDMMDGCGVTTNILRIWELWSKGSDPVVRSVKMQSDIKADIDPLDLLEHLLDKGNHKVQRNVYDLLRKRSYPTCFVVVREELQRFCERLKAHRQHYDSRMADVLDVNRSVAMRLLHHSNKDDYNQMGDLLRFLQLLCEGHCSFMQRYLRHQKGKLFTVNVIKETCLFMRVWFDNVVPFSGCMKIGVQALQALAEFCQGPCEENQLCLVQNGMVQIATRIVAWRMWGGPFPEVAEISNKVDWTLRTSQEAVTMLLSLTEGIHAASELPQLLMHSLMTGQVPGVALTRHGQRWLPEPMEVFFQQMNEAWVVGNINAIEALKMRKYTASQAKLAGQQTAATITPEAADAGDDDTDDDD